MDTSTGPGHFILCPDLVGQFLRIVRHYAHCVPASEVANVANVAKCCHVIKLHTSGARGVPGRQEQGGIEEVGTS